AKHVLTATATNSSGQTSAASGAVTVTVDTVAPAAPTMATPTNNANGGLNLAGTAEANSVVKVFDGTTQIGTATANSTGGWGYTTDALAAGSHSLTAKATDAAGNTGAASAVVTASTGTSAPPAPPTSPTPTPGEQVESAGATSLVESGGKYYLNSSSGSGPTLKYGGADFVDGQDGTWTPIGAEKTATGYQVAWKEASTGQYTAWNTDNNGNYVSHVSALTGSVSGGSVSGTNYGLKLLETSFHQDLNGDGQVGASSAPAPTSSVDLTTMYKNWSDIVTIKGVADANSQIKLYDGNASLGTVNTAADGSWSFKTSSAVSDTVHTYTAKQIDSTGQVVGTSGNATLGSTGSNTLTSTSGDDLFVGNGGADTFVFAPNFGNDVVKDFGTYGRSHDVVQFSKSVFDSFASVLAHATQVGQDVVISADADNSVTLKNTKLGAINSHDFHFS
uniref:Ig-like domain-containing protein n=1 Tax=Bradyrhizobium murdochi TaxID=1038859 RepID=UPI00048AEF43